METLRREKGAKACTAAPKTLKTVPSHACAFACCPHSSSGAHAIASCAGLSGVGGFPLSHVVRLCDEGEDGV